jgi:uncharacterized protein (TIGR02646 family)
MDEQLAKEVRERAGRACEYCKVSDTLHPGPFEIEHVTPKQHGGRYTFSNLAYSCLRCNRRKGTNLAGIDRATSRTKLVRLFNPRRHAWNHHFRWDGPYLVGKTAIGRVTIEVLGINEPIRVALRAELIDQGLLS